MLCYATNVTVNINFINCSMHSLDISYNFFYRHTCLAPEAIKKSISGPRSKKVVHHCPTTMRVPSIIRIKLFLKFYCYPSYSLDL